MQFYFQHMMFTKWSLQLFYFKQVVQGTQPTASEKGNLACIVRGIVDLLLPSLSRRQGTSITAIHLWNLYFIFYKQALFIKHSVTNTQPVWFKKGYFHLISKFYTDLFMSIYIQGNKTGGGQMYRVKKRTLYVSQRLYQLLVKHNAITMNFCNVPQINIVVFILCLNRFKLKEFKHFHNTFETFPKSCSLCDSSKTTTNVNQMSSADCVTYY